MPLRGAVAAAPAAAAAGLKKGGLMQLFDITGVAESILGNATGTEMLTTPPSSYGAWKFPAIPLGVETTIIPVAFPVTSAPSQIATEKKELVIEEAELAAIFFLALAIWMLPSLCINKRVCCQCFRKWISRRLTCYFLIGLIFNVCMVSFVISTENSIHFNDVFFALVNIVGKVTDVVDSVLVKVAILVGVFIAFSFRKKIVALLGFDYQIVKADLRDILTGFSMKRFTAIEIALWKAQGLPPGLTSRTLFVRVVCGYNEPCHSRPHDGITTDIMLRERMQLNYDEQDDTQKLTVSIKQQEAVGAAMNQFLPAAGAGIGALGGLNGPIGPTTGMAGGLLVGIGAANSMQKEVARVDMSSLMVNRLLESSRREATSARRGAASRSARPSVPWSEQFFQQVDLVPEGVLWLRISEVDANPD